MAETLANGYSFESTQQELSNEYQHDRVKMLFKNPCILVLTTKVALALQGLTLYAAGGYFGKYKMMKNTFIMTETLALVL